MTVIERLESEVRSYCRSFPATFTTAHGAFLYDDEGREYIDLLAGAGTLNYGHNNPVLKKRVLEYLQDDSIVHGLDLTTAAKIAFLETFDSLILQPRHLGYKVQFTGPTGTNAVEAALKLARKVTRRLGVVAFTNGYHGLTAGALAATGNQFYRRGLEASLSHTTFLPFCGYFEGEEWDSLSMLERKLEDGSSGLDLPAAIIVETVQGEGGVNVASARWLRGLAKLCRQFDILLIVDDIQMGCGRTGRFFSFEEAGIKPDMVTMSKSLGGYGLPMALLLIRPDLDQWKPGEHTGTFRGNNLAFVAATEALRHYWSDDEFCEEIAEKSVILSGALHRWQRTYPELGADVRGRGLIYGLECGNPTHGSAISRAAFERGAIVETAGADSQVVKFLPPLIIEESVLRAGLALVEDAIAEVLGVPNRAAEAATVGADAS